MLRLYVLIAAMTLGWAGASDAAIARNSATYTKCAANPCTNAHTVAGADPALAVCVSWWHYTSTPTITSATWNGLPLTPVLTASNSSCGNQCKVALYILQNPPAATGDTSITFSGGYNDATVGTMSFNGVDPIATIGTPVPATGSGTPASVTVSSGSGEVVLDCLGSMAFGAPPTPASGQTTNWAHLDANGFTHAASGYVAGVPSTVAAWTINTTGSAPPWAMIGVPLKPVGGGGGGGTTPGTQRVISWTDNSDDESCFHLQWQTDQSLPNWVDIQACLAPNTVSYPHNIGTQTGDCYRLEATNAGGSNGFTDPVCAASPPPPPPPPLPPPGAAVASPFTFDIEEDLL